ncbi:MAG: hypothetical protein HYY06_31930 [Deltaproteobacteria bacterium]|nr:hypothetical protein [Deltaproteobacteria bacterium]
MRSVLAFLLLAAGCSLVIGGRTEEYQGPCVDEQEALDLAVLYDGKNVQEISADCQESCDGEGCEAECISDHTDGALSVDCAMCLEELNTCLAGKCRELCFERENRRDCKTCRCEGDGRACMAELDSCAGVAISDCSE